MTAPTFISQSDFARLIGADKSRVSRWIAEGKIGPDAVVGDGRSRRINVTVAQAHLAARLDAGQALGNGARKKLSQPTSAAIPLGRSPQPNRAARFPGDQDDDVLGTGDEPDPDSVDYQAQRARLVRAQAEAQERKNAKESGELVAEDFVQRRWTAILADVRTYMLAVPGRVREALPELTATQVAKIDAEVRRALTDAAHGEAPEED